MGTQWRVGMAGATGLDYGVLNQVMDLLQIKKRHRQDVFASMRVMEMAVLEIRAEKS